MQSIRSFWVSLLCSTVSSWEKGPYDELIYGGHRDDLQSVQLYPYGFAWYLHVEE